METLPEIWNILDTGLGIGFGVLIVLWIVRGTLVPRRYYEERMADMLRAYEEMRTDCHFWRTEATKKTEHVDRALVVADTAVTKVTNGET